MSVLLCVVMNVKRWCLSLESNLSYNLLKTTTGYHKMGGSILSKPVV